MAVLGAGALSYEQGTPVHPIALFHGGKNGVSQVVTLSLCRSGFISQNVFIN